MSRTYRRKNETQDYSWVLRDWEQLDSIEEFSQIERITYDRGYFSNKLRVYVYYNKNSKIGKKRIAQYHSDSGTNTHKEPGPSWFRNLCSERPQRRKAKRELKKFIMNDEYEVILESKPPLPYWT